MRILIYRQFGNILLHLRAVLGQIEMRLAFLACPRAAARLVFQHGQSIKNYEYRVF